MNEQFTAATQYSDFKGTAAADDADRDDFSNYLRAHKLVAENEILVGVQMYFSEAPFGDRNKPVSVRAYVAGPDMEKFVRRIEDGTDPVSVRVVRMDLPLQEFFAFFKRFEIMISRNGELTGRELQIPE